MHQNLEQVLSITQCALNRTKYDLPITDEQAFYRMVYDNGLAAIAFSALNPSLVSSHIYDRLKKVFYAFVKRDQEQLDLKEKLINIFNRNHIDFVFLKGIELKKIYPESYMRGMGDIDILIKSNQLQDTHKALESMGITCKSRSKQHDVFESKEGLMIEIHPTLYKDFNEKFEKVFNNAWDYSIQQENRRYQFSHEFEVVYLLYHLAKHLDSSGIGLRSVLDIGLYIKTYEQKMDDNHLDELLTKSDMHQFYVCMVELNRKLFGFEYHKTINQGHSIEQEVLDKLTDYIVKSGVHGLGKEFNPFEARAASYQMKNKSKTKMIFDIIFPSFEHMKGMYPNLLKVPIFLPLAWGIRWFKLLFRKRKSSIRKIKKLNIENDRIEAHKELFEKIGLK